MSASGTWDRSYRREITNDIVKIFQDVESFMGIQMRRENERRHYTNFYKVKIMIIRLAFKSSGRVVNLFIFYFLTMFIHPSF